MICITIYVNLDKIKENVKKKDVRRNKMAKVSKEELKKRILEKKKEIRDAITGISKYITKNLSWDL